MIVSDVGMQLIAEFEGFSGFLYDDPGGHATIGFGFLVHLGNYHRPRGICAKCDAWPRQAERDRWISAEAGRALLRDKVRGYADAVFANTAVTLTQGQFDALTSLTYNIGAGGFRDSAVRRAVNAGQDPCPAMRKIIYAVGSAMPLPGLVRRREAECALFHSDIPKAQEGRVYSDVQIDAKVGEVLKALITLQNTVEAQMVNVDGLTADVRELTANIQDTFALANRNQDRLNRAGIAQ